jgi:hypothetical protein
MNAQNFVGELVYSFKVKGGFVIEGKVHKMEGQAIQRGEFYDSLIILYQGNQYKKTKNKRELERTYFDFNKKRSALIFGKKNQKIIVDDLSFQNLINQPCHRIGTIQNVEVSDTFLLKINYLCKYIVIIGEYGKEKYIISEKMPKLNFKRNILQEESCQVYQAEVANLINNSILLSYELGVGTTDIVATYSLEKIINRKLNQNEVNIPAYKEKRKDRRFNKFSQRIKAYTLVKK